MGVKIHYLSKIDAESRMGTCSHCGRVKLKKKQNGWRCQVAENSHTQRHRRPYIKHKADYCQRCGFLPVHEVQLDVDHIDGDHANNDPSNLQTLCANCHRLKSWAESSEGPNHQGYWQKGPRNARRAGV